MAQRRRCDTGKARVEGSSGWHCVTIAHGGTGRNILQDKISMSLVSWEMIERITHKGPTIRIERFARYREWLIVIDKAPMII